MISKEGIVELSKRDSVQELIDLQQRIEKIIPTHSEASSLAYEMFRMGSNSHLNSLSPIVRDELGFQLDYMTQKLPNLHALYLNKKNKYLSLGKTYGAIFFLFDLVDENISELDFLLMHEILMDDGKYRDQDVFIQQPDKTNKVFLSDQIDQKVSDLFAWYESTKNEEGVSQTVLGIIFHFCILSIHPFFDGNGRISRLFLNLILLKDNLFPVTIPDTRREEYYKSLAKADDGDFHDLIDFISLLVRGKLQEYEKLSGELSKLDEHTECLVLTEDGNTEMINYLLTFHGFDMNKTTIESYDGKDNIAAAAFLAKKTKEKQETIKHVIFHRDRDNNNPQQLKQIISRLVNNNGLGDCSTIFITKNYDMESYFLNAEHINKTFPNISVQKAVDLIGQATIDAEETSKRKLRIALDGHGRFKAIEDSMEKARQIDAEYDSNPQKYRYGKEVLLLLEKLLSKELNEAEKISLVKESEHIKIEELVNAQKNLSVGN